MTQLKDNGFKELRDKLYNVEIPVDDQIWASIQDSMRRRRMRKALYWWSSVAAVIILALLVMWPSSSEQVIPAVAVAEISESEVPVEVAQAVVQDLAQESAREQVAVAAVAYSPAKNTGNVIAEAVKGNNGETEAAQVSLEVAAAQVADVVAAAQAADVVGEEVAEAVAEAVTENVQAADTWVELWEPESYNGNKVAMAFLTSVMPGSSASAVNSSMRLSQSGVGSNSQNDVVEQISDTKYSLPINVGIQAQLPLKGNLALGLGVSYSVISSRFDCLINKKKYSVKQSLHYIGIPVNIYGVVVERNRFSFYVNAGATVEKGLEAVYKLQSYTGNERFTDSIDGVQFSVNAGLGVEYKLANPAGIYFEPNMVYFFNSDVPRSMRTDQPLQVKGELGLRFHF